MSDAFHLSEEIPKQKHLHFITDYRFEFPQDSSLQQYAEIPKQKHAKVLTRAISPQGKISVPRR